MFVMKCLSFCIMIAGCGHARSAGSCLRPGDLPSHKGNIGGKCTIVMSDVYRKLLKHWPLCSVKQKSRQEIIFYVKLKYWYVVSLISLHNLDSLLSSYVHIKQLLFDLIHVLCKIIDFKSGLYSCYATCRTQDLDDMSMRCEERPPTKSCTKEPRIWCANGSSWWREVHQLQLMEKG